MTTQPPRRGSPLPIATQRVAWGLVGLQVLLLLALLLPLPGGLWPAPAWLLVLGAIACLTGLAIALAAMRGLGAGLTASPLPNDAARLRTTGIFAYARHPIYSALMLIGLGLTLPSGSAVKVGILIGLIVLLNVKARWEETKLRERFPGYGGYAADTSRFLPRGRPTRLGGPDG